MTDDDQDVVPDLKPDELLNVRARIHKLNDTVQRHELLIAENRIMLTSLNATVETMRSSMSTREQLDNAVRQIQIASDGAVALLKNEIQSMGAVVEARLGPIWKALVWTIGLVVGGVILAALAFLIRKPGP